MGNDAKVKMNVSAAPTPMGTVAGRPRRGTPAGVRAEAAGRLDRAGVDGLPRGGGRPARRGGVVERVGDDDGFEREQQFDRREADRESARFSVPLRPNVATKPTPTIIDGRTTGRIVSDRSVRRPGSSHERAETSRQAEGDAGNG